jgi:hypothetical protein
MRTTIVFALLAAPAFLSAQTATVSPGMNHAQVVAALGEPVNSRTANEYTYLFYPNSCGKGCGMNDLVVLRRDSVVDAIFRSPSRHYTGTSSSPEEATPVVARKHGESLAAAKPVAVAKPAAAVAKPTTTTTAAKPATTTAARPATTTAAKPAAAVVTKKAATPAVVTKPAATTAAKPVVTAPAKTVAKPTVAAAPEPAPVEARGTKTNVVVKGTNREVTVPGTNTDIMIVAPTKMAPGAANDTRPSIPVAPPMRDDAPPPATPTTTSPT